MLHCKGAADRGRDGPARVQTYIHTYTRTCVHAHSTHAYMQTYIIHADLHAHMHTYTQTYIQHTHTHMHACMRACMHAHTAHTRAHAQACRRHAHMHTLCDWCVLSTSQQRKHNTMHWRDVRVYACAHVCMHACRSQCFGGPLGLPGPGARRLPEATSGVRAFASVRCLSFLLLTITIVSTSMIVDTSFINTSIVTSSVIVVISCDCQRTLFGVCQHTLFGFIAIIIHCVSSILVSSLVVSLLSLVVIASVPCLVFASIPYLVSLLSWLVTTARPAPLSEDGAHGSMHSVDDKLTC